MDESTKSKSPFYPGHPVPPELFVGRAEQIDRIAKRGAGQVALGKPATVFLEGEYGIGKTSLAAYLRRMIEATYGLHGIYASLGGCVDLGDVAFAVLEATVKSGAFEPSRSERIRSWLARYVGDQELFGLKLNVSALKEDAPSLSTPLSMLSFLKELQFKLSDTGVKGIFLVLDEINGVSSNAQFANFIKGLVDSNAISDPPVPVLLMLCGVEERRREMIQRHQPVERIFDVVQIAAMEDSETKKFFTQAFESVRTSVDTNALDTLAFYSAGFPKIMHLVGDAAYWLDRDMRIDIGDATGALLTAADEVGKKYVDQQVYKALRSPDYRSILSKIGEMGPGETSFNKKSVAAMLTDPQKKKFQNFLQKMKQLKVLRSGGERGEWVFNSRMVQLYIWLQTSRKQSHRP